LTGRRGAAARDALRVVEVDEVVAGVRSRDVLQVEVDRNTADQVPNFVGGFTAFGADHHEGHEGHGGMSASYDITDLVAYLRARGEWDEAHVDVTVVPAAPAGFDLVTGPVNVGRISIRTS
jgi:hypothetical protein